MFPIFIWLLVFSGISVSQAQIVLPENVQGLVDAISNNPTNNASQDSLVKELQSYRHNDKFEEIIWTVANVLDPIKNEDVHYHIYAGDISNELIISDSNATNIPKPIKTANYAILYHGWMGSKNFMPVEGIIRLINKGYIVILAHYPFAVEDQKYISPALRSIIIGYKIGKTLMVLGIPPSQMTFVGHSLGGHIAAATSDYLSHQCNNTCKVAKIYGLDAAGPVLAIYIIPLSKESANYVAGYHTSIFGTVPPIGHVDYYTSDLGDACAKKFGTDAHNAIIHYFVKGIINRYLYKANYCILPPIWIILPIPLNLWTPKPQNAYMNFNTDTSVQGNYCVTLDPKSPECTKDY